MKFVQPAEMSGTLFAPPSKSVMQRVLACSVLVNGKTTILNPSFCDDSFAALGIAKGLGKTVSLRKDKVLLEGEKKLLTKKLDCGESGLSLRMFSAVCGLFDTQVELTGKKQLFSRPLGMIEKPLESLGVKCKTANGFAPVTIRGPMTGGKTVTDGSLTSQFLTGLLISLPVCKNDSEITVWNLKSRPYIEMTISLLENFGIKVDTFGFEKFFVQANQEFKSSKVTVEGDWSCAAFMLAGAAINGHVTIKGLSKNSLQADKAIVGVLKNVGANVRQTEKNVRVSNASLDSFVFDATDCPDLFPSLVTLACNCKGKSIIYGAKRLKFKESDRAKALLSEFRKIGAKIRLGRNSIEVTGSKIKGGVFESHNDHRIAMAGAIAGLSSTNGVKIIGEKCVSKSYPAFFKDLEKTRCM